MKKAGVAVDNWKLPIFEKLLAENGYKYKKYPFVGDTSILKVKCKSIAKLQPVIEEAQEKCRKSKLQ